jgi:hypothetical protein
MSSKLDFAQVIKASYDATAGGLKTTSIGGSLVNEAFDYIAATYPLATQEVYTYKSGGSGGTTVATITVNYVDATKAEVLNVTKV